MRLYGLALYTVDEIIEWFPTREEAEEAVQAVVTDEPSSRRSWGWKRSSWT